MKPLDLCVCEIDAWEGEGEVRGTRRMEALFVWRFRQTALHVPETPLPHLLTFAHVVPVLC